ncbi:MAG: hypothetical protein R3E72_07805 [Steroidobacteraceae bacterium]
MTSQRRTSLGLRAISLLTVAFGLLTIREGGSILFGTEASRLAAGDYVPFVLWFNFIAGFAYLIAGVGLWLQRRWAATLSVIILAATLLIFAAFGLHVYLGGAYEQRTFVAMSLRAIVWAVVVALVWRGPLSGRINRSRTQL